MPLSLPLCEPEDEKTKIELKICQLDQDSGEEAAALLELIAVIFIFESKCLNLTIQI